jgi:predicted ATPase
MPYTGSMRLNMLGGLALEGAALHRPKPLLLLAYLSVEGSKEKRHLYELFWPEAADQATSLRMALSQVRKVGAVLIHSDERTVSTGIESDLAALQSAVTERNAGKLLELYRGDFLQGFSLSDWSPELEEWVYSTREFIASRVRATFLQLAETEAAKGKFVEAAQWGEKAYLLGKDNHDPEEFERLYPLLLASDSALSHEVKKQAKDYGLELNLSRDEAKARYGVTVSQDSSETRSIPNNLPKAKTSFIGRDPELVEVGQMLQQSDVRLITLLGPGGMGKTRLALQLAHGQLQEALFAHGIYFVALDVLEDPTQIPLVIAQTLGLTLQSKDDPRTAIQSAIGDKHMLLVLDNFEQLMDGVMLVSELLESCPNLKVLVTSRERLNLEEEFVSYLQGLSLPRQDTTDLSTIELNDAVKLFVQRAKRARLDFQLSTENLAAVLDICKLVDGSPLGIELAAVWLRSLTPADLVREIKKSMDGLETPSRNIAEKHQSLRAVFEHSWRLLKPKEQRTLAKLTVFLDGFTREAAGVVTDATIPLLTSLVDKSLLRLSPEGRYDFHPLLHQYANEKLTALPEEKETRANHAHYFLSLIEASSKAGVPAQIKCAKSEYQNLLVALTWSQESSEALFGLRLAHALSLFWETQGYISEARGWLEVVLSHPGAAEPTDARAKVLLNAANHASSQAEYEVAQRYLEEALSLSQTLELKEHAAQAFLLLSLIAGQHGHPDEMQRHAEDALGLARQLEDDELIAQSLVHLASAAAGHDDYDKTQTLTEESIALFRKLGLQFHVALKLNNLGFWRWLLGDLQAAKAHLEEAVAIAQSLPDLPTVCLARSNLSGVMLDLGDLTSAGLLARQALEFRHKQNDRWGLAYSLENFACLAVVQGEVRRAAHLWGVTEILRREIDAPMPPLWRTRYERFVALAKRQLDEASFRAAWQEGQRLGLEEAVTYALNVKEFVLS